VSDIDVLAVIN